MSIAGTATSLDAFPTAPARTLMVRVRLLHAAFSSGPTPPAITAPRPLSRPPQLLQISIVGAPGEPRARRAGKPAGTPSSDERPGGQRCIKKGNLRGST